MCIDHSYVLQSICPIFTQVETIHNPNEPMPEVHLTDSEKSLLLKIARQTLEAHFQGKDSEATNLQYLPPKLREWGATFVTLTKHGELRGCVGALEAYQPLVDDVREHALAAAFNDYRFPPLSEPELAELEIEISFLTQPKPLDYSDGEDLIKKLRPTLDGVILRDGTRRATFLPQVWEKIPNPAEFLDHLCLKMGAQPNLWRYKKLQVLTYQVEMFEE